MGVPHLELDAVFHQPGWQELDRAEFRATVEVFTQAPGWVVDGNYGAVRDLVWARADTVVWLDPPRRRVMRQVIGRTLRRAATRQELWNGNREPVSNLLRFKPEKSIIAWAWTRHDVYRQRYLDAQADPANASLTFVRLATAAEISQFLLSAASPGQLGGVAGA